MPVQFSRIEGYVSEKQASTSGASWSAISNKPFSTVNSGSFTVTSDDLRLAGNRIDSISERKSNGGPSSYGYRGVRASYVTPTGATGNTDVLLEYVMESGTATKTVYDFNAQPITVADKLIDVYSSIFGEVPANVETTGTYTVRVTFAESKSRNVAIVMR